MLVNKPENLVGVDLRSLTRSVLFFNGLVDGFAVLKLRKSVCYPNSNPNTSSIFPTVLTSIA